MAYQLNSANVVADTIDGEVLAIRSDTGTYYSMTGTAATAWTALVSGSDSAAVAEAVAAHHDTDVDAVSADLSTFAHSLVEDLLIVEAAAASGSLELPPETKGLPWSAPTFERFTDMQDLLLFDPIHEVEPTGWPAVQHHAQ